MADSVPRPAQYAAEHAREYDRGMEVLFKTFGVDEAALREQLTGLLHLGPAALVLETGCGTGRDTVHLAAKTGMLYATDLSPDMIEIARARLATAGVTPERCRLMTADATALPFDDAFFDAAYHFGGINLFPDVRKGIAEMARVVKPGGRVVFGDEGVAPWLADSEFGKILRNSNELYRLQPPLALLPVSARDVACRWILNGAFYVVDFTVGTGEPFLDLDLPFPGWRGGSHRTRYYGKLDGVAPELRQQVVDAAAGAGLSITDWLEQTLSAALKPK
jgi:SAM-dependent methyltransferase